jgi:hypothetical protein
MTRACKQCGTYFTKSQKKQKFCSKPCQMKAWAEGRKHPLSTRTCARVGCNITFTTQDSRRRFCCKRHQAAQWATEKHQRRTKVSLRYDTCRHGHDRSPENTHVWIDKNGHERMRCRVCYRIKARERWKRMRGDAYQGPIPYRRKDAPAEMLAQVIRSFVEAA